MVAKKFYVSLWNHPIYTFYISWQASGSMDLDVTSPKQLNRRLFLKQLAVDLCTSERKILFRAQYVRKIPLYLWPNYFSLYTKSMKYVFNHWLKDLCLILIPLEALSTVCYWIHIKLGHSFSLLNDSLVCLNFNSNAQLISYKPLHFTNKVGVYR